MAIARPESAKGELVARFEGAVDAGAQLVVAAGDACVIFEGDKALRVLEPGSYEVPTDFAGPGIAAWFVWTRPFSGLRFGTQLPPMPSGGGPPIRSIFGEYTIRVIEPSAVVKQVITSGGDSESLTNWLNGRIVGWAKNTLIKRAMGPGFSPAMIPDVVAGVVAKGPELEPHGLALVEVGRLDVS